MERAGSVQRAAVPALHLLRSWARAVLRSRPARCDRGLNPSTPQEWELRDGRSTGT